MISAQAQKMALDAQERLQRSQRRLAPGSLGGRSEQAQQPPRRVTAETPRGPSESKTFYLEGSLDEFVGLESGLYTPRTRGLLIHVVNELLVAGGSATTIEVLKAGAHVTSYTIPAGITYLAVVINAKYQTGADALSFVLTAAGSGAMQLSQTSVFV